MSSSDIVFTSFGLIVLDEIRFTSQQSLTDVLGGSGTYATLGARLFLSPPMSRSIGWMIHIGYDFPNPIRERMKSWDTTLITEKEVNKPSTRGLLQYKDSTFGSKDFKYSTPILAVHDQSLEGTALLNSRVFHYLASPQAIREHVPSLQALRKKHGIFERPLVIWEPAPLSCTPENFQACLDALPYIDVVSPNHIELASLLGRSLSTPADETAIEDLTMKFLGDVADDCRKTAVIVRAGEKGCVIATRNLPPMWIPPYYEPAESQAQNKSVIDPTGAGNAFLGAYAVGYLKTGNVIEAACYGSVGASFMLEQVGVPERTESEDGELWNGVSVSARLKQYMSIHAAEISFGQHTLATLRSDVL